MIHFARRSRHTHFSFVFDSWDRARLFPSFLGSSFAAIAGNPPAVMTPAINQAALAKHPGHILHLQNLPFPRR
jgi:hypothetical protein